MKASELPKLHREDPSGRWKLVRTGTDLPKIGQRIMFVYDIRGTEAELRHDMLARIANGDAYRLTNGKKQTMPPGVEALNAEIFKLPVAKAQPITAIGIVDDLGYDPVMDDWWIAVKGSHSVYEKSYSPEHIVYWAPMLDPFDGYVARTGDLADLYYTDGIISRESAEMLHEASKAWEA